VLIFARKCLSRAILSLLAAITRILKMPVLLELPQLLFLELRSSSKLFASIIEYTVLSLQKFATIYLVDMSIKY